MTPSFCSYVTRIANNESTYVIIVDTLIMLRLKYSNKYISTLFLPLFYYITTVTYSNYCYNALKNPSAIRYSFIHSFIHSMHILSILLHIYFSLFTKTKLSTQQRNDCNRPIKLTYKIYLN
jgi:hypothetical protein